MKKEQFINFINVSRASLPIRGHKQTASVTKFLDQV